MELLAVGNRDPYTVTGGYERTFRSSVEHLRALGHSVRVMTGDAEFRWYWRDGDFFAPSWAERRAIERHNAQTMADALAAGPDAVVWWGMGGMSLGLIEQVRRAGVPAVGVVGDGWMVYGPRVDRPVALGPCAHWIFNSRFTYERTLREGYIFPSWSVAHPGVDPAQFPPAPAREWTWRLGYVGRASPEKGIDTVRRALDHLPPEAALEVNGGGDGYLPPDRVHGAYAAADVVVFPPEWDEPWGLVPLEAMSVGRPVVATGTGGSAEYLADGENCLLFPPGDAEALAAAIRRLAGAPDLRARLVEAGRRTAAHHTEAAYNDAILRAIEAVTA